MIRPSRSGFRSVTPASWTLPPFIQCTPAARIRHDSDRGSTEIAKEDKGVHLVRTGQTTGSVDDPIQDLVQEDGPRLPADVTNNYGLVGRCRSWQSIAPESNRRLHIFPSTGHGGNVPGRFSGNLWESPRPGCLHSGPATGEVPIRGQNILSMRRAGCLRGNSHPPI